MAGSRGRRAVKVRRRRGGGGGKNRRNWADLPGEVLSVMFEKLGSFEVLVSAQVVCRAWHRFSHEPAVWRCVHMRHHKDMFAVDSVEEIAMEAVTRSKGLLEEFHGEYCGDDALMRHIGETTNRLRCLRLISCYDVSETGLIEIARRFPLLEELDITLCDFTEDGVYESVGRSCSQLKRFHLNHEWYDGDEEDGMLCDIEAFAIAKSMHELRHLQLVGNQLTNAGLSAILDNCPHLESLDIRHCFNVKLNDDMKEKLSRVNIVRLPGDSMHDYGFISKAEDNDWDCDSDSSDFFSKYGYGLFPNHGYGDDVYDFDGNGTSGYGYDDFTNPLAYEEDLNCESLAFYLKYGCDM